MAKYHSYSYELSPPQLIIIIIFFFPFAQMMTGGDEVRNLN